MSRPYGKQHLRVVGSPVLQQLQESCSRRAPYRPNMSTAGARSVRYTIAETCLAVALLAVMTAATASATPPPTTKTHTLTGVVVSKVDGKPVAGAKVALAQNRKGHIFIGNGLELMAFGPEKKLLLFIPKRNGKTACETTADEQGRFTLKSFVSMSAKHSLVAGSKDSGLAILYDVRPKDYADKPLRIEIDKPAYFKVPEFPKAKGDDRWCYTYVELAPEVDGASGKEGASRGRNVSCSVYLNDSDEERGRVGPLVAGKYYRVVRATSSRRLGYSAKLFEMTVKAEAGETLPIKMPTEGGTEVSGRIVTKEGSPLPDVNVMIRTASDPAMMVGALTDKDGKYTIRHIPPGTHKLKLLRHAVRVGPG